MGRLVTDFPRIRISPARDILLSIGKIDNEILKLKQGYWVVLGANTNTHHYTDACECAKASQKVSIAVPSSLDQ